MSVTARRAAIATIRTTQAGVGISVSAQPAQRGTRPVFVGDQDEVTRRRQLNELAVLAHDAHVIAASNLFAGGVLTEEIVCVAGTTVRIQHGLGRAPFGWFPVSTATNPFVASAVALPTGLSLSEQLWLLPTMACTTRLYIF